MFHEFPTSVPSIWVSRYDPGRVTSDTMNGPSHSGDSLCHPSPVRIGEGSSLPLQRIGAAQFIMVVPQGLLVPSRLNYCVQSFFLQHIDIFQPGCFCFGYAFKS
jgi:hypothetical protein